MLTECEIGLRVCSLCAKCFSEKKKFRKLSRAKEFQGEFSLEVAIVQRKCCSFLSISGSFLFCFSRLKVCNTSEKVSFFHSSRFLASDVINVAPKDVGPLLLTENAIFQLFFFFFFLFFLVQHVRILTSQIRNAITYVFALFQ